MAADCELELKRKASSDDVKPHLPRFLFMVSCLELQGNKFDLWEVITSDLRKRGQRNTCRSAFSEQ